MSIIGSNVLAGASGGAADTGYQIQRSLRFNQSDTASLSKTFSSAGNRKTWTWSSWVKLSSISYQNLFANLTGNTDGLYVFWDTNGKFYITDYNLSGGANLYSDRLYRDHSAWYHIVIAFDTTQATAANRVKLYINGVQETLSGQQPNQNIEGQWNQGSRLHYIGRQTNSITNYTLDGYLADCHFVDGQALAPTDFGEFDDNNVWQPKEFTGSYTLSNPNDGSTWSSGSQVTGSAGLTGQSNLFDGTTNNNSSVATVTLSADNFILWTPSSALAYSNKVEIYTYAPTGFGITQYYSLNGGTETTFGLPGNSYGWTTVATGSGSITSLKVRITRPGSATKVEWGGIRVDGVVLQDGVTGSTIGGNSFRLGFSDKSSNAALGTDSSGNSNTWTVNNLTATGPTATYNSTYGSGITATEAAKVFDGDSSTYGVANSDFVGFNYSGASVKFKIENSSSAVRYFLVQPWVSGSVSNSGTFGSQSVGTVSGNQWTIPANSTGTAVFTFPSNYNGYGRLFPSNSGADQRIYYMVAGPADQVGIDSLVDTPTNYGDDTGAGGEVRGNYATLNPLHHLATATLANGNLQTTSSNPAFSSILITSGKWYVEHTVTTAFYNLCFSQIDHPSGATPSSSNSKSIGWYTDGTVYWGAGYDSSIVTSYGAGDILAAAIDMDNSTIKLYKNGSLLTTIDFTSSNYHRFTDGMYVSQFSGTGHWNFGQRAFAYAAPSGYKALCTQNLPEPTIADGSAYMDVLTWSGNNTYPRSITGLSFSPDLIWLKNRTSAYDNVLMDAIRGTGTTKWLSSNLTSAEGVDYANANVTSLDATGFTIGSTSGTDILNQSGTGTVAWTWDAGANSSKTYAVTVVSDSGNKYRFDGHGTSAVTLDLEEGSTYTFDQSDSSNAGHPLRFSTTSNGTHGGGSEYTTGVTTVGTPGSAGASTTIVVASGAPTLYYYCSVHSGMGGQANTNSTAGASNFDGSIQATVRANPTAGFSVVTYTGDSSSSKTVGHGLGAAPQMIIFKRRNTASDWAVYHTGTGNNAFCRLNLTNSADLTGTGPLNATSPTSSVFTVGNDSRTGDSSSDYVAYCFSPVSQFSAMGSYTGNGSTDGPFVYTGFRPAFVLIKGNTTISWHLFDNKREGYNVSNDALLPNDPSSEFSNVYLDLLSNGFKIRQSTNGLNSSSVDYIYIAFAENPFRTARAR